jgi:hypothetical protein
MKTAFTISITTEGNSRPSLKDVRRMMHENIVGAMVDGVGRDADLLRIKKVTVSPIGEA